ncbi:phosphotransferase [Candidatus Dependentiae bacterium]|nr:phosphotransferase [Candidatus Dependentiae bacterium]
MSNVPKRFKEIIINTYGQAGVLWLEQLESIIASCAHKWGLEQVQPFHTLSYNYVVQAYSQVYKAHVALKLAVEDSAFSNEQQALEFYNGQGCVALLDSDATYKALLLQKITPGTALDTLFAIADNRAVIYTVEIIKKLHSNKQLPACHQYFGIQKWLNVLYSFTDERVPRASIIFARQLAEQLLQTAQESYLLHGDLHHGNILFSNQKGWIAIDPKGIAGELAYEVGAFIRNPFPELILQAHAQEIIARRLNQFSELLHIDRTRLARWAYVQAIIATCWACEDQDPSWQNLLSIATLIQNQL